MMMPYKQVLLDVAGKHTAIKLKPRTSSSAIPCHFLTVRNHSLERSSFNSNSRYLRSFRKPASEVDGDAVVPVFSSPLQANSP